MFSKHYQSTPEDYANYVSLRKTPELQQKAYSFKDPLYESFGNGYLTKAKLPHAQKMDNRKQIDERNQRKADAQVLQEALEIAHQFSVMKNMLKIIKPIYSPSVLLVNTQNKLKTEMIVQSKQKNQDQDSKILCENANKYLNFLEILKQEQRKYPCQVTRVQTHQIDVKINLESRIQNRTQPFSNQNQSFSLTNPLSKQISAERANFDANYLPREQEICENNLDHSFAHDSYILSKQGESLANQDYSQYLASYQKESRITHNSENTDKMFQKIQTPKIYQNLSYQKPYFTPFQQNHPSQNQSFDTKISNRKHRKFEKSPPNSSAVLQTKNLKISSNLNQRENIHNQKIHREFKIEESEFFRKQTPIKNGVSKGVSKSSYSKSQSLIFFQKDKESKKTDDKRVKQKIKIGKNLEIQQPSKNLVMKVVDKTSQFQKMLKMASSRMNPA